MPCNNDKTHLLSMMMIKTDFYYVFPMGIWPKIKSSFICFDDLFFCEAIDSRHDFVCWLHLMILHSFSVNLSLLSLTHSLLRSLLLRRTLSQFDSHSHSLLCCDCVCLWWSTWNNVTNIFALTLGVNVDDWCPFPLPQSNQPLDDLTALWIWSVLMMTVRAYCIPTAVALSPFLYNLIFCSIAGCLPLFFPISLSIDTVISPTAIRLGLTVCRELDGENAWCFVHLTEMKVLPSVEGVIYNVYDCYVALGIFKRESVLQSSLYHSLAVSPFNNN